MKNKRHTCPIVLLLTKRIAKINTGMRSGEPKVKTPIPQHRISVTEPYKRDITY